MARRIVNRMEKRAEYEAFERRQDDDTEEEEEEGDEDDEEEDGEEGEEGEESESDEEEGEESDEDEVKPPKKVKKPAKPKAKPRARASKIIRLRVVWGVFNNSHQMVASYDYPKKQDAEAHAAKLTADKRSTHFVQPVKEPIEEIKEK